MSTKPAAGQNASYDKLEASRTTATFDVKVQRKVSDDGSISFGAGIGHDLALGEGHLSGYCTVLGLEMFSLAGGLERRTPRGALSIGYATSHGNNRTFSGDMRIEQTPFGDRADVSVALDYTIRC